MHSKPIVLTLACSAGLAALILVVGGCATGDLDAAPERATASAHQAFSSPCDDAEYREGGNNCDLPPDDGCYGIPNCVTITPDPDPDPDPPFHDPPPDDDPPPQDPPPGDPEPEPDPGYPYCDQGQAFIGHGTSVFGGSNDSCGDARTDGVQQCEAAQCYDRSQSKLRTYRCTTGSCTDSDTWYGHSAEYSVFGR